MASRLLLPTAEEKQGSARTGERERGRLRTAKNADVERRHTNGVQTIDRWILVADEGDVEHRRFT